MEIKGIEYRLASNFAQASQRNHPTLQISEDNLASSDLPKAARTDIVDIWKAANPEPPPLVEGYTPPDILLKSFDPAKKLFCDVETFVREYKPTNTQGLSDAARLIEETNNTFGGYANLVKAYDKAFSICDEDIAFCAKLVEENTDLERAAPLTKMLEDAKTRRRNIGEQAAEDLSSRAAFMRTSMPLWAKIEKTAGNADDTVEAIEEGMWKNIFAKLEKFDFSQLANGYEQSLFALSQLKDMFSEWY